MGMMIKDSKATRKTEALSCLGIISISLILLLITLLWIPPVEPSSFRCSSSGITCKAIVDYVSPNTSALSTVMNLFNVTDVYSFLGVNNFSLSTSPANQEVTANRTVKIPIPCICNNGTGKSNNIPVYRVVPGDGLYHIAAEVFSGLVTFPEIQAANNIREADVINPGQELWIPLPCSCDAVDGEMVVHYAHVVPAESSLQGIAQQFNVSQDVLLRLNGNDPQLKAGAVLDVPLKACRSTISNNSLDYPLLVPDGTYTMTAADCVMCKCDGAANNWTLQCDPSQSQLITRRSSVWTSCPSMQCQAAAASPAAATTTTTTCNRTTCSYAGYTNTSILTTVTSESTCPASAPPNNASTSTVRLHGCYCSNLILIAFNLLLLIFIIVR